MNFKTIQHALKGYDENEVARYINYLQDLNKMPEPENLKNPQIRFMLNC